MEQRHLLNHELARTAGMLSGARRGAMMLVATLLFTLTAQTAWAQELLTSGKCGVNEDNAGLVWSFDTGTKTLTISLEDGYTDGEMAYYYPNYVYEDLGDGYYDENKPAPWRNYTDHNDQLHNGPGDLIEHIVVEEGVYRISENAFYGLANLKDVTLASTVNVLGEGAMKNTDNLTSVILLCPAFISDYGYAFDDSDQLTIYVIKQQASNFEYYYSKIKVEGFLLTGDGYNATPNKATRELLDVKRGYYTDFCTLTLNGDHTATINGKSYTIKSGTEITGSYYDGVIKEDTQEALDFDEVTETGEYRYKVQTKDVFADEAKENVVSDPFTVTNSPASGEGWVFNIEKSTLTISGNVTGEPWKPFADGISYVVAEKNVTKMPENAFTDRNAYNALYRIILRSTAVVDLNGAFNEKYEVWDSEVYDNVEKDRLAYDIYVPSSILADYRTTYASLLEEADYDFFAFDISVTLPASGVMTFSADTRLDFTHSEGLKAYIASEFIPATGKVVMERVMTVCGYEGLVLKGTPNTTYSIEMGVDDSWVNNLLQYGYNAVDPADNPDYTYLQLDGTEFKEFTTETNLEGQAYLKFENGEYEGAQKPITMFFSDEDVMTSGVVNGDCYWSYDADTKTLTLSGDETGTGSFAKEYDPNDYRKPAPWRTWTTAEGVVVRKGVEDGIEHIVVENGVNYIGDYAFYGLKNLESVSLAPSVYSLYEGALQGCTKLKTVVCSYLSGIDIDTEDDTYSVANVGETYYVPNFKKVSFENSLKAFNVKVEGFYLSEGELKADFYADPLEWDKDHYTGDISMIGHFSCWIEGAKATINGIAYTYDNKIDPSGYAFCYRKNNQDPDLKWNEVTEAGIYYAKVTINGHFADEAKNTAITEHYADLYVAPSSGDGWSYDRDHYVLTVSGDVTGEPWKMFKDDMNYVVVEKDVTQLPEKAFYDYYINYAIIKGAGVDMNKAFLCFDYVYDESNGWIEKEFLCANIFVPAACVADYNTAYASYLEENGGKILSSDVSIDMKEASEGIRTYSDDVDLDLSACEGLHAYTITNFNATTGALTLKPVTKMANYAGYLLMGETSTYTAKVTAGVDWEEDNMLISTDYAEPEETDEGVTYTTLILAGSGAERGFHPLSTGGYLPDHVAVLLIKKEDFEAWKGSGAAPLHLEIEGGDVTAISTMKVISTPADDAWYTLSGVRMEGKPAQKGVYIHQGKLIVIK